MRQRQIVTLLMIIVFAGVSVLLLWRSGDFERRLLEQHLPEPTLAVLSIPAQQSSSSTPHRPLLAHPIQELIDNAEKDFQKIETRQSRTLDDAVKEYQRRYGMTPPPKFDEWYKFANDRGVKLIDEYDTIYHSILPFWALKPSTIRARAREALGFDNELIALAIRDGRCVLAAGGDAWQQNATVGMMHDFVAHLPDMDLAFNIHDEPRVVVPHDDLARLVSRAKKETIPAAMACERPTNEFSPRPNDLNDGMSVAEVKTTRFNRYAHQPTWLPSKLSCPPDSPARSLDEPTEDDVISYALEKLGFIYNATAFSDVCLSPSLRESFGFFDRPNAFNVVHELFPIFSQSKLSTFQDILYPSPWYWAGRVTYEEDKDFNWEEKNDTMYWRGSTTGGYSRDGGWRRQHRQKVVRRINAPGTANVLKYVDSGSDRKWDVQKVSRQDYEDLFDVKFSHVGQCDPGDCDAQREFFEVVEPAGQQDAWGWKYLLDMDGNAFSGRFYAFLHSKSLIYKLAIFREWHQEWLKPWIHYIPLSMRGDDYVESVRYFANEEEGRSQGPRLAMQGREWASQALRKEDMEAWFFRLLLE